MNKEIFLHKYAQIITKLIQNYTRSILYATVDH